MTVALDVILFIDFIAAIIVSAFVTAGAKHDLSRMPPYAAASENGGLNYKLSARLQRSLYNKFRSGGERVTEEIEYEAYRQDAFCISLLRLLAVNFIFAVVADLCCFFDGYSYDGYSLGIYTALCGIAAGIVAGMLLGLYFSRLAYKAELAETLSRADSFVREDGTIKRSSRNCYLAAYLVCVPAGCLLAATAGFTVYTLILMLI
ncbi:MAG: hypothetical protein LUI60_06930 [Clostridia bacterium]|nr:hypothetical protein [Clostridia bacterium]